MDSSCIRFRIEGFSLGQGYLEVHLEHVIETGPVEEPRIRRLTVAVLL